MRTAAQRMEGKNRERDVETTTCEPRERPLGLLEDPVPAHVSVDGDHGGSLRHVARAALFAEEQPSAR